MRIPHTPPAAPSRDWPAARPAKPTAPESTATAGTTPADRGGPPGLQKVLERLQAIPEGERTRGQTQAMTRIERNLQRYLDNQGQPPAQAAPDGAPVEAPAPVAEAPEPPVAAAPEPPADA